MEYRKPHILVVDDEPGHVATLKALFGKWHYHVSGAHSGECAVDMVKKQDFDLILMDICMEGMTGIGALKDIKAYNPALPVIIMTAYSTVGTAVDALKSGAHDYLLKPLDFDVLREVMHSALEHCTSAEKTPSPSASESGIYTIIGESPPMRALEALIRMAAPTDATVLVTGRSGTGKELVAAALHTLSNRASGPLVTVNCSALSEHLLESELFGHEKGAFTGADRRREGRFFQAQGGTIFLDEIGEVSPQIQVKLLRVLQQREIQRVGSDKTFTIDVRIVAATNRDLREEVAAGRFREDLYYRLNVLHICTPSLTERQTDIPLLAQHFLQRFAEKNNKDIKGFTPRAMNRLLQHSWPGNVRELENAVEQSVILQCGAFVDTADLPAALRENAPSPAPAPREDKGICLGGSLDDLEREAILQALRQTNDSKTEAAERLGISRKTLYLKLKRYGM